jgi:hypothetical protein
VKNSEQFPLVFGGLLTFINIPPGKEKGSYMYSLRVWGSLWMLPQPVFILLFYYYFWYWKFDNFFWKIEKLLELHFKNKNTQNSYFLCRKMANFHPKKTLPPTRVELIYGLNQRHYINNGSLLEAVQIFPWLPICQFNCGDVQTHFGAAITWPKFIMGSAKMCLGIIQFFWENDGLGQG